MIKSSKTGMRLFVESILTLSLVPQKQVQVTKKIVTKGRVQA